jgi:hypothetical protein
VGSGDRRGREWREGRDRESWRGKRKEKLEEKWKRVRELSAPRGSKMVWRLRNGLHGGLEAVKLKYQG